jgi:D-glycero-D-manno-heptose 1,7-bisphosphate phosphatase
VLRAAIELELDLERSWLIGDTLNDVEAGKRAGCRTILVDLGTESAPRFRIRDPDFVAQDTRHALRIVRAVEQLGPAATLNYRPARWQPVE